MDKKDFDAVVPCAAVFADKKYLFAVMMDGSIHRIEDSLVSLLKRFEGRFVRISRDAIVVQNLITRFYMDGKQAYVNLYGFDEPFKVSRRECVRLRKSLPIRFEFRP